MSIERLSSVWPDWQAVELIGEGSFGKVYKAVHTEHSMTSYSAIKVISVPHTASEVETLAMEGYDNNALKSYFNGIVTDFIDEIKLMQSMKGAPGIVSIEDFKVLEKEDSIGYDIFIRMELLIPFKKYVKNNTLTEKDVIKLGIDIATALDMCSRQNIIHRDIKPENIFVTPFGDFKVGDFGIARKLDRSCSVLSKKGTYDYIAPEVIYNQVYDQTVDVYSLGLVLYKLLNNNRLPFVDTKTDKISFKERKDAANLRLSGKTIPPAVNASKTMTEILSVACDYTPANRFQAALAFKNALIAAQNSLKKPPEPEKQKDDYELSKTELFDTPAPPLPVPEPQPTPPKKAPNKKRIIILISAGVAALVIAVVAFFIIKNLLDPSRKVLKSLKEGDYDQAILQYEDMGKPNDMLIEGLEERIDKMSKDYKSGKTSYERAITELDTIAQMEIKDISEKLTKTKQEIEQLNSSQTNYNKAVECEQAGNLPDAINHYKAVGETYSEYQTAQTKVGELTEKYRTDMVAKADSFAKSKDYKSAFSTLDTTVKNIGDDPITTERRNTYTESLKNETIKKANDLIAKKKYDDAKAAIAASLKIIPDNGELMTLHSSIDGMKPITLDKLTVIKSKNYQYRTSVCESKSGKKYKGHFNFDPGLSDNASATYNLNKSRSVFTGTVILDKNTGDYSYTIQFKVDGKVKHTIKGLSAKKHTVNFKVNVSGGSNLEILVTPSQNGPYSFLHIVNTKLVK